jgi:TonB family protein
MRRFLLISLVLHAIFLVALFVSSSLVARDRQYPPVYQVKLIAASPGEVLERPRQRPRPPEPKVEEPPEPERTPEPEPEILEPEPEPLPAEKPKPEEPEPEPEPEEKGPETPPAPEEEAPENPTPEAGGNDAVVNLETEGAEFPFPGYIERIVNKIAREWKRTPNLEPLKALVYFRVERSGDVSGIEIEETSGDFTFDQAALRAVYDASPLPPLPDGYTSDYLGVFFDFNEENLD